MKTKNSNTSILTRLKNFILGKSNQSSFSGSLYPLGYSTQQQRKFNLEIPYQPVRPILNSFENSQALLEMATWSYETRHAISNISRDCFQHIDGTISSWQVGETFQDVKINKDVQAIARDLATRQQGKEYVLGGNKLKKACADMLFFGDSFLELSIEKDGISKEYGISKSLFLRPLSTFADVDDQGQIQNYFQRESVFKQSSDISIDPIRVLQFTYEKNEIYGIPLNFQSLNAWRQLKKIGGDLEQASRETGNSLLVHSFSNDTNEMDRQTYQIRQEEMLQQGIITNLYLLPGAEVTRLQTTSGALDSLINLWIRKREECIPPGVPLWFFPGLGLESSSGKDIANQPALNYARLIAYIRSIIGEQIKYAINLELIMKKGFDWYVENQHFDIVWENWIVTGNESRNNQENQDNQKSPIIQNSFQKYSNTDSQSKVKIIL